MSSANVAPATAPAKPKCFVIMPMTPLVAGYDEGHFKRVYEELIVPACDRAGFKAYASWDSSTSELIMADVLRQLIDADMVLCDMSSRNPNVFFELGLRQAFDKPVALIKDEVTPRPFDVAGLRDVTYQRGLRVDQVRNDVVAIAKMVQDTHAKHKTGADTLMHLINMQAAVVPEKTKTSHDTQVLLNALKDISARLASIEPRPVSTVPWPPAGTPTGMTGYYGIPGNPPAHPGILYMSVDKITRALERTDEEKRVKPKKEE